MIDHGITDKKKDDGSQDKTKIKNPISRERVEKAGYSNIFEAIVIASKWARDLNIERKRKKETGKILEEFELEEFAAPKPLDQMVKEVEVKVTTQAISDLIEGRVVVEKKAKEKVDDIFKQ
jgi:hypothetical protein